MLKLLDTYKSYIIVALVALLVAVAGFAYVEVSYLEGKVSDLTKDNATLRARNETLASANKTMATDIGIQNAAIAALRGAQEKGSISAERALAEAVAERDKWRDRYVVLFKTAPATRGDFSDIAKLVDGYYKARGEESKK